MLALAALWVSVLAAVSTWALAVIGTTTVLQSWIDEAPQELVNVVFYGPGVLVFALLVAAIVLDIWAGARGGRDRIVALCGGLLLLSCPIVSAIGSSIFGLFSAFGLRF
jgi:hypothetical protein